jgi:hypothetical protein
VNGTYKTGTVTENLPPIISSVTAPTTLGVGEKGTWKVSASDPENGPLSYSINWGEQSLVAAPAGIVPVVQTSTFTHTYSKVGNYIVLIIVKDSVGQTAESSVTVDVTAKIVTEPVTCTSFAYTSWGACVDGSQSRESVGSPAGCIDGNPVLTQSCSTTPITKDYSKTFSLTAVDTKTFDLGKVVNISSLAFTWTDNTSSCKAEVRTSALAGSTWTTQKGVTDVASPASFTLTNIGDVRYIKFINVAGTGCASYNVTSATVTGTYIETSAPMTAVDTVLTSNTASAVSGWQSFVNLIQFWK